MSDTKNVITGNAECFAHYKANPKRKLRMFSTDVDFLKHELKANDWFVERYVAMQTDAVITEDYIFETIAADAEKIATQLANTSWDYQEAVLRAALSAVLINSHGEKL